MRVVNLSNRPFLNTRPVFRVAALFWLLGGLLLAGNLWNFGSHAAGFSTTKGELETIDQQIDSGREQIREVEKQLGTLSIEEQNAQVAYFNTLIARRTFPWSLLFDHLEAIVPEQVRLNAVRPEVLLAETPGVRQTRLSPTSGRSSSRRGRTKGAPSKDQVHLEISGVAGNDDQLLDFIDALFASPRFDQPSLHQESRDSQTNEIRFGLDVIYLLDTARDTSEEPAVVLGKVGTPGGNATDAKPANNTTSGSVESQTGAVTGVSPVASERSAPPSVAIPAPSSSREGLAAPSQTAPNQAAPNLRNLPVNNASEPQASPRQRYIPPAEKRRIAAETAARQAAEGPDSEDDDDSPRPQAPATRTTFLTQPVAQAGNADAAPEAAGVGAQPNSGATPTGRGAEAPEAAAPEPEARRRPTLERPTLGPPSTGTTPEASATPRLRRPGGRS